MGASKLPDSTRVVFPAALSGIVAAIVLGVSRGIGETMIALIAAGQIPNTGLNVTQPFETITTFIGATAKGDNPAGTVGYYAIFACGMTLFVLTLIMNAICDPLRPQVPAGVRVSAPPPPLHPTRRSRLRLGPAVAIPRAPPRRPHQGPGIQRRPARLPGDRSDHPRRRPDPDLHQGRRLARPRTSSPTSGRRSRTRPASGLPWSGRSG